MKTILLVVLTAVITVCALAAFTPDPADAIPPISLSDIQVKKTMKAFKSDAELAQYFREVAAKQRRRAKASWNMGTVMNAAPAPMQEAAKSVDGANESVTNVQHAGVDEGGIVKVHGNHLVVMRRGRLFTVAVGDTSLKPVSAVDAFGPEIDPRATWYDEMLIAGNTVVVIGYSYERGGTEVGLFDINNDGQLSYRSTYHLRSNDYYSSRNYASRLIGNKLIFYTPLNFYPSSKNPFESLPAVRKWHAGAKADEFRRIVPAKRIYRPEADFNMDYGMAMHTVTVCDLANGGFDCQATTVLGPDGHVFYVSPDSVYVWASSWTGNQTHRPLLFRMPLDGSGPSALRVAGSPVDQFSLLQSDDHYLNVLVRSEGKGDGMWAAEMSAGDVALMRIPLMSFSDGREAVPASSYRALKSPQGYTFHNRFIGDYLLYGTGNGWGYPQQKGQSDIFIVNWRSGNSHQLPLPHGVDRIEQLGSDAVIVGSDNGKDLHFSSVKLSSWPEVISRYTRKDASQGEQRSHGFFYKPENDSAGTLGLPISLPGRAGYKHLFENSAAILFLRNDSLHFREVGELGSEPDKAIDDKCRASCVDWYGNARPLFLRGRVFALLGYEIVEGAVDTGLIREVRRVNFAPGQQQVTRGE